MANQRGVACRAQGWKVHLCAAQLLQLVGSAAEGFISTISGLIRVLLCYT